MEQTARLNELIIKGIKQLSDREKQEVLNFIEFLRIKEDQSFIEYVNRRTQEAIEAKKKGQAFSSLEELQKEYA
ncbi:MAG: hypothetical protein AMJ45_00655 [Syntrophobacter sp. DG_60]|nr:MAG: hypothetical protein AMJ45_00655 [Syntrophobacter sp. DG_60]